MTFNLERVVIIGTHDQVPRAESFYDKIQQQGEKQEAHTGPVPETSTRQDSVQC